MFLWARWSDKTKPDKIRTASNYLRITETTPLTKRPCKQAPKRRPARRQSGCRPSQRGYLCRTERRGKSAPDPFGRSRALSSPSSAITKCPRRLERAIRSDGSLTSASQDSGCGNEKKGKDCAGCGKPLPILMPDIFLLSPPTLERP